MGLETGNLGPRIPRPFSRNQSTARACTEFARSLLGILRHIARYKKRLPDSCGRQSHHPTLHVDQQPHRERCPHWCRRRYLNCRGNSPTAQLACSFIEITPTCWNERASHFFYIFIKFFTLGVIPRQCPSRLYPTCICFPVLFFIELYPSILGGYAMLRGFPNRCACFGDAGCSSVALGRSEVAWLRPAQLPPRQWGWRCR